jgi:hypothetical protein
VACGGHLGQPTVSGDGLGHLVERAAGTPGQEDLGSFAGEGLRDGATDRPAGSVDNGVLVVQQDEAHDRLAPDEPQRVRPARPTTR